MVLRTTVCKPDQGYLGSYDFKKGKQSFNKLLHPTTDHEWKLFHILWKMAKNNPIL